MEIKFLRTVITTAAFTFLIVTSGISFAASQGVTSTSPLSTKWANEIDAQNVLPEYPRPTMKRDLWMNLNGIWQFEEAHDSDALPVNKKLTGTILVPFAWESGLSGVRKQIASQRAWYKRSFTLPNTWKKQKTLLHFGAVDWETHVYVNGKLAGTHKGGFDSFYFDITSLLNEEASNELIVNVYDPGNSEGAIVGKQANDRFTNPHRYSYSPSSGIWQTVWLESVSDIHITHLRTIPDIDSKKIAVAIDVNTHAGDRFQFKAIAKENGKIVSIKQGVVNEGAIQLDIPNPKLWWPESPYLYDLDIELINPAGKVIDRVDSYFGMRKISLGDYYRNNYGPVKRIMLNNKFVFQMGPLDQGYWPDGLFTAPTDEALRWELEQIKAWGFNMVRKHIKVEPQRWYYWADKLGVLVWQDMPSTFKKMTNEEKIQFEVELQRMIKLNWNHPSIVNWIIFNEHWGAYDVERLTNSIMALDRSRLITGNSGIDASEPDIDYEVGHIKDNHSYRPPTNPHATTTRAVVNGEYGAIGYKVKNHLWDPDGPWVHDTYEKDTLAESKDAATTEYVAFISKLREYRDNDELSGAVYTQWTDVENEVNGLYTYDRKIEKLDRKRVRAANLSLWKEDETKEIKTRNRKNLIEDAGPEVINP